MNAVALPYQCISGERTIWIWHWVWEYSIGCVCVALGAKLRRDVTEAEEHYIHSVGVGSTGDCWCCRIAC